MNLLMKIIEKILSKIVKKPKIDIKETQTKCPFCKCTIYIETQENTVIDCNWMSKEYQKKILETIKKSTWKDVDIIDS